jgi:hypothetical protein
MTGMKARVPFVCIHDSARRRSLFVTKSASAAPLDRGRGEAALRWSGEHMEKSRRRR